MTSDGIKTRISELVKR